MNEQNPFVLVSIQDNFLMGHWSFRAPDELAVARHLLHHLWEYEKVFWALRIPLRDVEGIPAEDLLQAIHDSYSKPHGRAVLHLFRISQPAECAETGALGSSDVVALN